MDYTFISCGVAAPFSVVFAASVYYLVFVVLLLKSCCGTEYSGRAYHVLVSC